MPSDERRGTCVQDRDWREPCVCAREPAGHRCAPRCEWVCVPGCADGRRCAAGGCRPGCGRPPDDCARPPGRYPPHTGRCPPRPAYPRVNVGPCCGSGRAPAGLLAGVLIGLGALLVLICVPVCVWPVLVGAGLIALGCAVLRRGR